VSRKILSAFLALALIAGFTAVTKADVTGSFDLHITMEPMGTQTESVEFFFDVQSNLDITITMSGLSIGADIGFGVTGVEFAIISLSTSLGALAVDDKFVFAMPFGCDLASWSGQCPGAWMIWRAKSSSIWNLAPSVTATMRSVEIAFR